MTAGPGHHEAATPVGRSHMKACHADREQIIDVLKAAFVQDRLTKDEFDDRVGLALASRTYAELAAVTADIPAGLARAQPPRRPPRRQVSNAARWGTSGLFTPVVLAAALAFGWLGVDGRYEAVAFVIAFVYFVVWLSVGAEMLWQWHCASLPAATMCVRCAHTAASHRTQASCAVRPGSPNLWRRCPGTGYVPPGLSPQTADLGCMAVTGLGPVVAAWRDSAAAGQPGRLWCSRGVSHDQRWPLLVIGPETGPVRAITTERPGQDWLGRTGFVPLVGPRGPEPPRAKKITKACAMPALVMTWLRPC
jgi:hypothetical protein